MTRFEPQISELEATALPTVPQSLSCGQSYKHFTILNRYMGKFVVSTTLAS